MCFILAEDCSYLQSVGLGGNDIQDEGVKILANALKSNTRLKSLGLGGNQIGKLAWQLTVTVYHVNRYVCTSCDKRMLLNGSFLKLTRSP